MATFWYNQRVKLASSARRGVISRTIYFGLGLATMLAGLALRLIALGLPYSVTKWGGSALWAAMVYWLLAALVYWLLTALLPLRRTLTVAMTAGVFATLVESVRLYHAPGLDAFRITLAGKLLLGRIFSYWDIVAYWAAIGVVAAADWTILRPNLRGGPTESGLS